MFPTNINKEKQKDNNLRFKVLEKLANITAKISLKYNIHYHEFFNLYKGALVKQTKANNPEFSNVEIACKTGIDRRQITQCLNSQEARIKTPKLKLILDEIKRLSIKNNSNIIKKHGPFQSFDSICKHLANGSLTPASIANELIRQGNIIDKGDTFELIVWRYIPMQDDFSQQLRLLTNEVERLSNTVIYNYGTKDTIDKQFQRNIFSTQISPNNFFQVKSQISNVLEKSLTDIETILIKYEENVPNGTYTPFGASMFVFGYENKED